MLPDVLRIMPLATNATITMPNTTSETSVKNKPATLTDVAKCNATNPFAFRLNIHNRELTAIEGVFHP